MTPNNSHVYSFGPFELRPSEQQLSRDGQEISLTPKVFALLVVLVENANHLVSRDELIRAVWPDAFVEEANVSRCIFLLRKALADGTGGRYIETIPKIGYRFIAEVTVIDASVERVSTNTAETPAGHDASARPRMVGGTRGDVRAAAIAACVTIGVGGFMFATWKSVGSTPPDVVRVQAPSHRQITFTGTDASPALSPDGRYVAYVSDDPPRRHVVVREVDGGQPMTIATSNEAGKLRWSPDGSRLTFWLRGDDRAGIYVAPRSGGPAERISSGPFRSCWSADGKTIATGLPNPGRIALRDLASGSVRYLTLQGQHVWLWDIDWSPEGDRLVFVSQDKQGRFAIFTIQADGTNQRRLVEGSSEIPSARWSPRGDAIYFSRRVDQTVSIFKVRLTGAGAGDGSALSDSALVTGLESDGLFEVSADGKRLTYAREPYFSNLWLVDLNGAGRTAPLRTRQLTAGTSQVERPSVSPDGKSILYTVGRDTLSNLYLLPLMGGLPRQLTFLNAWTAGGVWSPDGTQVAFGSNEGGTRRIWIADTNGALLRAVSTGDVSESLELTWASGSALFYQQAGNRDHYVVDPRRDGDETMLWHRDQPLGWLFSPVVSPDGRKIAVMWNRPKGRGIWTLDAATGEKALLASDAQADGMPLAWSRDGRHLYLVSGERAAYRGITVKLGETTKNTRILSVPAVGGPATIVAELPFQEIGGISMTPDGKRLVCAVYTSRSDVWIMDHFDPDVRRVAVR